jgi:ATP-binding protein involved in chromosome partitioning
MFWNKAISQDDVKKILSPFFDLSMIDGIVIQDDQILVTVEINPADHKEVEKLVPEIQGALQKLKGVKHARIILTAEKQPEMPKAETRQREIAPHIKKIIAVASGKGGVGKSTVAVNLALSLQQQGLKVGLLDADIYGPSIPMLLGLRHQKPEQQDDYIIPLEAHGIKVMSMGFMVAEEAPMVWRGPMVQSALIQMLRDVQWGTVENELDILVIDMPPGTGDTQLTIAQRVKLSGAVIVSTPQDVALLDTVKGVEMFRKVSVPILGIIENMSVFCCPHCGKTSDIFGTHGARDRAAELNVDFLGGIPIDIDLRLASDKGLPLVLTPDHTVTKTFNQIAAKVTERLNGRNGLKPAPRILIEPKV